MAKMAGSFVGWCRLTCRTVWGLSMDGNLRKMEHRHRGGLGTKHTSDSLSPDTLAHLRDPGPPPAEQSRGLTVDTVTLVNPGWRNQGPLVLAPASSLLCSVSGACYPPSLNVSFLFCNIGRSVLIYAEYKAFPLAG